MTQLLKRRNQHTPNVNPLQHPIELDQLWALPQAISVICQSFWVCIFVIYVVLASVDGSATIGSRAQQRSLHHRSRRRVAKVQQVKECCSL
jgi:hypothetical protein